MATMRHEPYKSPMNDHADNADAASSAGRERIDTALRIARRIPRQLGQEVKTRPAVALAVVGGVSFVAGMFFGSKMGRMAMTAALVYGVKRLVDQGVAADLGRYITSALVRRLEA